MTDRPPEFPSEASSEASSESPPVGPAASRLGLLAADLLIAVALALYGWYARRPAPLLGGLGWALLALPLCLRDARGVRPRWAQVLGWVGGGVMVWAVGMRG